MAAYLKAIVAGVGTGGVDGMALYGILGHRFEYSGGFANGVGPGQSTADGNNAKDVFGWVAYKLGGLSLAEADYVFYPWLHGAFRYDWLDPSARGVSTFKRVTGNVGALIRANIKAVFEWQRDLAGIHEDDYIVRGALRFAF